MLAFVSWFSRGTLAASLLLVVLAGCSTSSGNTLLVNLRTDLVPPEEFAKVRVSLVRTDSASAPLLRDVAADPAGYTVALRLTEFEDLAPGSYRLQVEPLLPGSEEVLTGRPVLLELYGNLSVSVPISRSCLNVNCGEEQACFGGQCVDLRCTLEDVSFCAVASVCDSDASCAPTAGCASGSCEYGICWARNKPSSEEGACTAETEWCHPHAGCQPAGSGPVGACEDGLQNGDETGVDCGPSCGSCKYNDIFSMGAGVCALLKTGQVFCWGKNNNNQFSDATTDDLLEPTELPYMAGAEALAWQDFNSELCGIFNGTIRCGENQGGVAALLGLPPVDKLVAGSDSNCALAEGRVYCWGDNRSGQLGFDSGGEKVSTPALVEGLLTGRTAEDITLGGGRTACALAEGRVYCWGAGSNGRLGRGEGDLAYEDSSEPVAIVGDVTEHDVVEVAGGGHFCARTNEGAVYCWGTASNEDGIPSLEGNVPPVVQIEAGFNFGCGLSAEGLVHCWGTNGEGQLGLEAGTDLGGLTSTVPLPGPARQLVTGRDHGCALTFDDRLLCWGDNSDGELGQGNTAVYDGPVEVPIP